MTSRRQTQRQKSISLHLLQPTTEVLPIFSIALKCLPHATFAVNAHGTNSELRNAHFTAVRVKDAIVDQLIAKRGSRPMVNTEFPDVTVTVRITKTHASLGIDLAGDPLFKRGIISRRTLTQNLAPLRPDYAAALLATHGIYGGNRNEKHGGKSPEIPAYEAAAAAAPSILFSGAGSLVHELVGIRSDCAPGLLRTRWGLLGWAGHEEILAYVFGHREAHHAAYSLGVAAHEPDGRSMITVVVGISPPWRNLNQILACSFSLRAVSSKKPAICS